MLRKINRRFIGGVVLALLIFSSVSAREWHVRKDTLLKDCLTFSTIERALANAVSGDTVRIFPGVYDEYGLRIPDQVTLIGNGYVHIRGELPVTVDCRTSNETSTVDFFGNGRLENLTVTARNMRYPIHSDFSSGNTRQDIVNCRFIHYGSKDLYDYRKKHGLDTDSLFIVQSAWGGGTKAGDSRIFEDCYFESPMRAFSTHNNVDFHKTYGASTVILNRCEMISHGVNLDGRPIGFRLPVVIQSLESHTVDRIVLSGCRINGYLCFQNYPTHSVWCDTPNLKLVFNMSGSVGRLLDQISVLGKLPTWYPVIPQETICAVNDGIQQISQGKAVKQTKEGVALMTSADSPNLFLGVVLENINPGCSGNVKVGGYLPYPYFSGLMSVELKEGQGLGVDSLGNFCLDEKSPVAYVSDNKNITFEEEK